VSAKANLARLQLDRPATKKAQSVPAIIVQMPRPKRLDAALNERQANTVKRVGQGSCGIESVVPSDERSIMLSS